MMRRQSYFYGAILATSLLGFAACRSKTATDEAANADAMVVEVTLARVARSDIQQIITLTGTVAALPNQDVKIAAFAPGRIAQMHVAEGDVVKAGQVLARLDDQPARNQLQQAEAAVTQAKASLENAKASRVRNETLFARGIAAGKEVEDARTQEAVAASALHQAEAALETARLQVARTAIVSPVNGIVAKRFVNVGEQVDGTSAQPVVEVANLEQMELLANLPANYLGKLSVGQVVSLTSAALPGIKLTGRVVAISPAVDPATNVGLARIRIANQQHLLRLGMFLSAQVPIETHARALVVPPQAIYRDEQGRARVFRVEQDTATAVPVTLGIEMQDHVELLSGVKEGDQVILTGGYGLGDKAKIKTKS